MLKNIKIRNFHSIGDEQVISLEISEKDVLDKSSVWEISGCRLNLISGLVGHNASGKTTVLKAISFLLWFISQSYTSIPRDGEIPVIPHKLKTQEPTQIEVEFINKTITYRYTLVFNKNEVLKEQLKEKKQKWVSLFELQRENNATVIKSHRHLKLNEADKTRFEERRNVSVLSSLIETGYLPTLSIFKEWESNVGYLGTLPNNKNNFAQYSQKLHDDTALCKEILDFIIETDFSISKFQFNEVLVVKNSSEEKKIKILECIHATNNKKFSLPIFQESDGTQRIISILVKIFPILRKGGIVVLDEIERDIHPLVIKKIIALFEKGETNQYGAQLIFSTHQHLLMNDRTKTQLFITEKNNKFETEVYRLDDVEGVRNDENFFNKYIAGTYGGNPNITWF